MSTMMSEEDQQQPTPVTVVEQPIALHTRRRTRPFLLRGAKLSKGCRCPGALFIFMVVLGMIFLLTGFGSMLALGSYGYLFGPCWLLLGVLLLMSGCYRLNYGTGYRLPIHETLNNDSTHSCQYSPGAQMIPSAPSSAGSSNVGFPVVTFGQPVGIYPAQATRPPVTFPAPSSRQPGCPCQAGRHMGGPTIREQPGGYSTVPSVGSTYQPSSPRTGQYIEDPPPPYSEVIKDSRYQQYIVV